MEFALNDLYQEIFSWKNLLKEKDEKNDNLQKQLLQLNKENETLATSHKILLHEISELNDALSTLRNSFIKIEDFEAERKILLEEKKKLKNYLESLEKLYHNEKENTKKELEEIKKVKETEITRLVSEIKHEAIRKCENLKKELNEKEENIKELKSILSTLQSEKDKEILKIKVEYEVKIGKLKLQLPKSREQASHNVQMHDIFRQKYHKLEKESAEEISKLKEQVKSLQLLNESLKLKYGTSSLSSVLITATKQNTNVHQEVSTGKSKVISLPKRVQNEVNRTEEGYHFSVKKKNFTKTDSMTFQKRKLFNLNENYFIK